MIGDSILDGPLNAAASEYGIEHLEILQRVSIYDDQVRRKAGKTVTTAG